MRTPLPFSELVDTFDDFSKSRLNKVMHKALALSQDTPCSVELSDGATQRFAFFRANQVYSAGSVIRGVLTETTIRDFILGASTMNFPRLSIYGLNDKILHSTLILFQKKPTLQVLTSLVDLDELLDRIETQGKSCVVNASRDGFMTVLRYEKGRATAMCHEKTSPIPTEQSFREDFLVKIYTITADQPLTLSLYEDLLVSYTDDAKTIPGTFSGNFDELFLSKPPVASLQFKGKEIDTFVLDKHEFTIGRTPDNDIVIDNLAVSRLHAILEEDKGSFYVRDCDSLNGTVVNGNKVGRALLNDGDEVLIGKHTIVFRLQGGQAVPAGETIQGMDQTMIIPPQANVHAQAQATAPAVSQGPAPKSNPRLIIKTEHGSRIIELNGDRVVIGKGVTADVPIDGMFVAKEHAEIICEEDRVILRHVGGLRKVKVGGKSVKEIELKSNDEIRIAKEAFVFEE